MIARTLARLITRASQIFVPLCPGGCRQPVGRCTCSWLPPLPDELFKE